MTKTAKLVRREGDASELRLCEHCRPHIERLLEDSQGG